jgi:hypothetical protein
MATIVGHTTRAAGTILTAAIYNADHVNHVTNAQNLNSTKLEGAPPPVGDGHAAVFNGTSGAELRTGGAPPVVTSRQVATGAGLTGGGDLSVNRTLLADFADQATAEAGVSDSKVLSPLRVRQWFDHANAKSSQAEAEAGAVDTKWVSPAKLNNWFDHANQKASEAEAQAGTDDTKWMSPLRVAQAAAGINLTAAQSVTGSAFDTGVLASKGGAWLFHVSALSSGPLVTTTLEISLDDGANWETLATISDSDESQETVIGIVYAKGNRFNTLSNAVSSTAATGPTGNIKFRRLNSGTNWSGSASVTRVM